MLHETSGQLTLVVDNEGLKRAKARGLVNAVLAARLYAYAAEIGTRTLPTQALMALARLAQPNARKLCARRRRTRDELHERRAERTQQRATNDITS